MKLKALWLILLVALVGCARSDVFLKQSSSIMPVQKFDANRYLGKWYELGRIENNFERGIIKTKAQYSLNSDGSIKVVNSGYDPEKRKFRDATGKAKFVGRSDVGALKVSFFGPFYGGYNVVALDKDYQWAVVVGPNPNKYFWVLSRQPKLTKRIKDKAIAVADNLNVGPGKIIWVQQ